MKFKEKLFVEPVDNSVQFEIFKQKVQNSITRHVFHGFEHLLLNNSELIKILLQYVKRALWPHSQIPSPIGEGTFG